MGFNKGVSVLECHRDLYMHIKAREGRMERTAWHKQVERKCALGRP